MSETQMKALKLLLACGLCLGGIVGAVKLFQWLV